MKSYKNLYPKIYSYKNLERAFRKARKDKSFMPYVVKFEKNLENELRQLQKELIGFTYLPRQLKRFIVRDPKTRTIHSSVFRDRVIYHAICNILEPIFDKTFINDSYASRKFKGTLNAVIRFDKFKRKASNNLKNGYCLKADIKHYFEEINHNILLKIIKRKIKDNKVIWLIKKILNNYIVGGRTQKGMPLGNLTSQFFANLYLNELDYFIKHKLKVKYYIRYVDDFVILHQSKEVLEIYKDKIDKYLKYLKLELHPNKSKIMPLKNGIAFLGYRIFYNYKLLKKNNINKFKRNLNEKLNLLETQEDYDKIISSLHGWFGYAMWADTYNFRKGITKRIEKNFLNQISSVEINRYLKCLK